MRGDEALYVFSWISLYGISFQLSKIISEVLPFGDYCTAIGMFVYTVCLLYWLHKRDLWKKVGLKNIEWKNIRQLFVLLPLFLLPLANFYLSRGKTCGLPEGLLMLCTSLAEEIFFRGYLLGFLKKYGRWASILFVSGAFALFHSVNLFNGMDRSYVVQQIVCAFSISISYCAVTLRCNSILPCVAAHFIGNCADIGISITKENTIILWSCILICAVYGVWLSTRIGINSKTRRKYHETVY